MRRTAELARRVMARGAAQVSIAWLATLIVLAVLAPVLPIDPLAQDLLLELQGPSAAHWFKPRRGSSRVRRPHPTSSRDRRSCGPPGGTDGR